MTHTPGPWQADMVGREGNPNDPLHCEVVALVFGKHVVIVDTLNCSCIFSPDDQRANARLIAAAPDMLEALLTLVSAAEVDGWPFGWGCVKDQVRAAIAKAKGP